MTIKAALIGCGKRAKAFAEACVRAGDVRMVGFADPMEGAADRLADQFDGRGFTDTAAMLEATRPDVVCLITRPNVRLEPIRLCAEAGVKAMLSEKPMCTGWAEAKAIHDAATQAGMQLSFCHQRRCEPQYREAKRLIETGALGKVDHIIGHCDNFYDWGTHWFDMMHHFNGETEANWIIAQAQRVDPKYVFDQPMDRCGVAVVNFANDVTGTLQTGAAQGEPCRVRVIGEEGTLWVSDSNNLHVWDRRGKHSPAFSGEAVRGIPAGVAETINAYREGRPSILDSANALRATQLIFAAYHSAMVGHRVELPLPDDFDLSLVDIFGPDRREQPLPA